MQSKCSIKGCDRPHAARGWCKGHHQQWRRGGTPQFPFLDSAIQFWLQVDFTENCWVWLGTLNRRGYGRFRRNGHNLAHRWAYEFCVSPTNLELDHLCRNPPCVRPEHLDPVPHAINMARAKKTHCKNGHPRSIHGYIRPDGKGSFCKTCAKERRQER